ncbi:hypothetical protein, partial [Enterobacter intestinihominis]
LSDRIYWEFLLFSCCFSPYFLHKKAGWRGGRTPPPFFKISPPGNRYPPPGQKKNTGEKTF